MKWFQHDTKALSDAKIEKLIMKYGIEGYGLYFACVEIIAGNLTGRNINFELEHDSEILAHKFKMDTLKVESMMKYMVELGLFEFNTMNGRVSCLKLLKRLDESTSKNPEIKRIMQNSTQEFGKIPKISEKSVYMTLHDMTLHDITLPDNINTLDFEKAWNEWICYRLERKKKLTERTIKEQLKFLCDNSSDAISIIQKSIMNGWIGLFQINGKKEQKKDTKIGDVVRQQGEMKIRDVGF